jgi:signal transduction histidine kinase
VTRAFLFNKTPYRNYLGQIVGLVVVARDITEHQRAAENLENSRSELRALSAQLQSVREEERMRIAREIHDELGQVLTGLKMDVVSLTKRMAEANAQTDWQQLKERSQAIAVLINNAILTVRKISTELRPGLLDAVGLTAAIEWQAKEFEKRTGIKCELNLPQSNVVLDQNRSVAVFRVFQEILTNVTRHAQASKVSVVLEEQGTYLFLEARDNGRGIKASEFSNPKSLGLLGMRERALLLGGEFNIRGVRGKGTTVTIRIPLEELGGNDARISPSTV